MSKAFWLDGTAYCVGCVESDGPCLSEEEQARAIRAEGQGRCGCCRVEFVEDRYEMIDAPTNGTSGQSCGTFAYAELPERVRAAIDAAPEAGEWELPALSGGTTGEELADLRTVVRVVGE